jgi:hypothetical protein
MVSDKFVSKYSGIADEVEKIIGTDRHAMFCCAGRTLRNIVDIIADPINRQSVEQMIDDLYEIWYDTVPNETEDN